MRKCEIAYGRPPRRERPDAGSGVPRWCGVSFAVLALFAASCGGGGSGSSPAATASPTVRPTGTATATETPATETPTDTPAPTATPGAASLTCEARPDPHCGHPLNDVLVPMLRSIGEEPRDAEPGEVCRRLAVDLLGRIPTESEFATCLGRPLEASIDAWIQTPEYEDTQHRFWSSELGYNVARTIWWQLFDLDEIVGQMVRGEISYDEFATQVIPHPAFVVPRFDDGWGAGVFQVFLGRPPRRDEMDGTRPLARVFGDRKICDGRVAEVLYQGCVDSVPASQANQCRRGCIVRNWEGGIAPCNCSPDAGGAGCYGTGFGEPIDLQVRDCEPGHELERQTDYTGGGADRCPDLPITCADLHVPVEDNNVYSGPPAVPLPEASDEAREELRSLGAVVTERGDFWEAAADRELRRLLGWWQSGFRQPDFDIPEVRAVLSERLRASGDLRVIQRLILTSLLYTAPAAAPAGLEGSASVPPWCSGPRKELIGESWLESAEYVVGEKLGICDYRFIAPGQQQADIMRILSGEARSLEPTLEIDPALFPGPDAEAQAQELARFLLFTPLARRLDGCRFDPRPRAATLNAVSNQGEIANALCALGRDVLPPAFDPNDTSEPALRAHAERLVRRALSRPAEPAMIDATVDEMRDCIDAGECGDAEAAARWLCARLLDSTAFALY